MVKNIHDWARDMSGLSEYKILQVGIGIMGKNHANAIQKLSETAPISLAAVCDADIDKLAAFREDNPDVPVYLTHSPQYQTADAFNAMTQKAALLDIPVVKDVAEIVAAQQVNTLMNCTNNDSHIPVLESALSVMEEDATKIRMVFQEKPFAHSLAEAERFTEKIKDQKVTFSLNSILEHSEIWDDLHQFMADYDGDLVLQKIVTSYGKDRTQDTRPATGGWVGLEGIHAVDISTALLNKLAVQTDQTTATYGFLAEKASKDGNENFAIHTHIQGQQADQKIDVEIEGSFAWQDQMRRTLYIFEDTKNNKQIVCQMTFDKQENGQRFDEMQAVSFDKATGAKQTLTVAQSNADKLQHYYKSSIAKNPIKPLYDIGRSMDVQRVLDQLAQPAKITHAPAQETNKKPITPDVTKMDLQTLNHLTSTGINAIKAIEMRKPQIHFKK